MKVYEEVDVFLNLALIGGQWSASCPCHFTPQERNIGPHRRGPRAGLYDVEK
jgi:hypothetical protein